MILTMFFFQIQEIFIILDGSLNSQNMEILEDIEFLLRKQNSKNTKIPVDLVLNNGNINLRLFHLIDYDGSTSTIKGLTQQEEYSYVREYRDPVFCYIGLDDVKELQVYENFQ